MRATPTRRRQTAGTRWLTNTIAIFVSVHLQVVVNTSEAIARDTRNVVESLVEFEQFSKDHFELNHLSVSSFDVEQLYPSLEHKP